MDYKFSTKRIQSYMSSLCGEYCIYFSHLKCLGYSFKEIMDTFSDDLKANDLKVDLFVKTLIQDLFV